jgi:hypothetical protein
VRTNPDNDDVIVRKKSGNPSVFYLVGAPSAPDQFFLRIRDEAVSKALAYAKHRQVRAWFHDGAGEFVLLGTFRTETAKPRGRL